MSRLKKVILLIFNKDPESNLKNFQNIRPYLSNIKILHVINCDYYFRDFYSSYFGYEEDEDDDIEFKIEFPNELVNLIEFRTNLMFEQINNQFKVLEVPMVTFKDEKLKADKIIINNVYDIEEGSNIYQALENDHTKYKTIEIIPKAPYNMDVINFLDFDTIIFNHNLGNQFGSFNKHEKRIIILNQLSKEKIKRFLKCEQNDNICIFKELDNVLYDEIMNYERVYQKN